MHTSGGRRSLPAGRVVGMGAGVFGARRTQGAARTRNKSAAALRKRIRHHQPPAMVCVCVWCCNSGRLSLR
eukprot:365890-Chlamydomonas_euryale.AAC.1